jgi:dnd system-associated protein 4
MRAIKRDDDYEDIVKALGERPHPDNRQPVFGTMRDVLVFAAAVGYSQNKSKPLGKKTSDIPFRIFESKPELVEFMYLLALASSKDKDIVQASTENDDKIATIFEQYANGGLELISEWLHENPKDVYGVETLISVLQRDYLSAIERVPELTGDDVNFD